MIWRRRRTTCTNQLKCLGNRGRFNCCKRISVFWDCWSCFFGCYKSSVLGRNYEKEGVAFTLRYRRLRGAGMDRRRDESRNTKNRSSRTLIKYLSLLWTDHSKIRINITSRRTTTTKSNKKADRNTAKSRCCDSSDGFPLENETNKNRNGGTPKFMEYRTTDSNNPFLAEKMPVFLT